MKSLIVTCALLQALLWFSAWQLFTLWKGLP